MAKSLTASLLLLASTLVVCCGFVPALLLIAGRALFPAAAEGSPLIPAKAGAGTRPIGSLSIAQPFDAEEYFRPRPSAVSHNATASGGSNLAANNPRLRDRVCRQLGPIVVYKRDSRSAGTDPVARRPQQDLEEWFAAVPNRVAIWASESPIAAAEWARDDDSGLRGRLILEWAKHHPDALREWRRTNPGATSDPGPEELVVPFLVDFAATHPGKWPGIVASGDADGRPSPAIAPVASDPALHAHLFDLWLSDPANADKAADLEPTPVDMVTTSASGLDPHVTLRNALSAYQLDRVAAKRTAPGDDVAEIRAGIERLAREHSFTPLSGLIGEPLVNVLALNVALDERYPVPKNPAAVRQRDGAATAIPHP